jgi:ATP-binding cassette subfamily B protein
MPTDQSSGATAQPVLRRVLQRLRPLRYVPEIFRTLWHTGRLLVVSSLAFRLSLSLMPVAILWVSKLLIDAIVHLQTAGGTSWLRIAELFCAEFALITISDALSRASGHVDTLLSDRFSQRVSVRLLDHSRDLDLETFENPVFQDRLERARTQVSSQLAVLMSLAQLLQTVIGVITMVAAVALYAPWLVAIQAVAVLPVMWAETHYASILHKLYQQRTPLRRTMEYLLFLGTSTMTVKETKAFGLGDYLVDEFDTIGTRFIQQDAKLSKSRNIVGGLLTTLGSVAYYAGYAYLVWKAGHRLITIGTLIFLSSAFQRTKGQMQNLFSTLSRTLNQAMYLNDVFEFFEMRPRVEAGRGKHTVPAPIQRGFEFRNVSFSYAGSGRTALQNVSFTIAPGESLALVGENGAGKTTLVKLLSRLYEPTAGAIYLDGIDLRDYDLDSLRLAISMVFQDFVHFEMTSGINIGFGDLRSKEDLDRLKDAAHQGLALPVIDRLTNGFEQVVGKRFEGGVELSGGEWQKLAVSRACMRGAQLLVLDEPAAALDPRAEHALFQHFSKLTEGRMAVLISHRFSTVRMADRILVLSRGRLREQGTHAALVANGGEYATLFGMQAAGYQANFTPGRSNGNRAPL